MGDGEGGYVPFHLGVLEPGHLTCVRPSEQIMCTASGLRFRCTTKSHVELRCFWTCEQWSFKWITKRCNMEKQNPHSVYIYIYVYIVRILIYEKPALMKTNSFWTCFLSLCSMNAPFITRAFTTQASFFTRQPVRAWPCCFHGWCLFLTATTLQIICTKGIPLTQVGFW